MRVFPIRLSGRPGPSRRPAPAGGRTPATRRTFLCGLVLACILFWPSAGDAQPATAARRKALQAYERASALLQQRQYRQAIEALEKAVAADSAYAAAHQQLGDLYRRQRDYERAVTHYTAVIRLDSTLTPFTWFGLGESLLHTGQYAPAQDALRRYLTTAQLDERGRRLTEKYLADCTFSLNALAHVQTINPQNIGPAINSAADEYFPKLTADHRTIIFTRKENDRENFYLSTLDSASQWQLAQPLQGEINSELYNEGAHCVSPDGKYLFFTGCNRPDGLGSCDIYVSRREGDRWGTPYNLGAPVNTRGWEAQPALSADGRTLYFVSNRRGGQGGYDLWKSGLQPDGRWSEPENLGPAINTPYDESSPYIHADNRTLYFVSDGWPGFGGKDIFRSQLDTNGRWGPPVNLGYPINDHHEQMALSVSMNGRLAFFAARRPDALGGLDIYAFELPSAVQPHPVAYLKGRIADADTGSPIAASVTVTDTEDGGILFRDEADYEDGTFLAPLPFGRTYALHIQHPGYLFFSEHYPLDDTAHIHDAYAVDVALQPIRTGRSGTLRNIFFETDRYTLLPASKNDLDRLVEFLQLNPKVRVEIGGHTDNTGSEAYNLTLSERRAKAVYDYLVQAGIAAPRLTYKGYGQSQPIAGNDTDEDRQLNRRTDFKIID